MAPNDTSSVPVTAASPCGACFMPLCRTCFRTESGFNGEDTPEERFIRPNSSVVLWQVRVHHASNISPWLASSTQDKNRTGKDRHPGCSPHRISASWCVWNALSFKWLPGLVASLGDRTDGEPWVSQPGHNYLRAMALDTRMEDCPQSLLPARYDKSSRAIVAHA